MPRVVVRGVPGWVDRERLLGPGDWSGDEAELSREHAADVAARLRGIELAGQPLLVDVQPKLKRNLVRAARSEDARRRRDTTPGFTRPGAQLDPQGKISLTPEVLALRLGERAKGRTVFDAMCGCGGNAIGFARAGCQVVAADIDGARLEMARHNAKLYGVADRIRFKHGDSRELEVTSDLLFLDPPWEQMTLLADFAAQSTWIKAPPGCPVPAGFVAEAWFGEAPGDYRRVKFLLFRSDDA